MADESEIRHGVPLPPLSRDGPSLFERLGVDDSFIVPFEDTRADILNGLVDRQAKWYGEKLGATFVTRRVAEGIGVWRVK